MINWRIYYEFDVFDNEQGSWEDAPVDGVQCVAVRHPVYGRQIYHDADYYLVPGGTLPPAIDTGTVVTWPKDPTSNECDHIAQTNDLGPTLRKLRWIKFGSSIPSDQYQKILKQACDDPVFPKTSPRRRASDRG